MRKKMKLFDANPNAVDRAVEPGDPIRKTDMILSGESLM